MYFLLLLLLDIINSIFQCPHRINEDTYPFIHYLSLNKFALLTHLHETNINYLTYEINGASSSFASSQYNEKAVTDDAQYAINNKRGHDHLPTTQKVYDIILDNINAYIDIYFPLNEGVNYKVLVGTGNKIKIYYRIYNSDNYRLTNYNNSLTMNYCNQLIMFRCVPFNTTYGYCFYLCSNTIKGILFDFSNNHIYNDYTVNKLGNSLGIQKYTFNSINILCSLSTSYTVECMNYTLSSSASVNEGNVINVLTECGSTIKEFDISDFKFNSDNEVLACCTSGIQIKCERISHTFTLLNKRFTIKLEYNVYYLNMKQVDTYYLAMAFMSDTSSYIYIIRIPTCKSFSHSKVVMKDINLDFYNNGYDKYTETKQYIVFNNYTSSNDFGKINYNGNEVTNDNINYESKANSFVFHPTEYKIGTMVYDFKIYIFETYYSLSTCQITITVLGCYKSCYLCSDTGTISNHNCEQCNENHYFSPTDNTKCFTEEEKEPNWYLVPGATKFGICTSACATCTLGKDETTQETNCIDCAEGYYKTEDSDTLCRLPQDIPSNYYKDGDIYRKCHTNCSTCSGGYDSDNMNCTSCKNGLKFIDGTKNCTDDSIKEKGYYEDGDKYYQCGSNCSTCSGRATTSNQNCLTCKEGYYLIKGTTNCVNEEYAKENGYGPLKDSDGKILYFDVCNQSCSSCSNVYEENTDNHNCINCASGYYKISGTNNCYDDSIKDKGYTLIDDEWVKCDDHCETCSQILNDNQQNCNSCKEGLYFIDGTTNCTDDSIKEKGYYFNEDKYYKCDIKCATCISETECVTCNEGYYPLEDDSNKCYPKDNFPEKYYFDESTGIIKLCYQLCLTCTTKGTEIDNKCTKCIEGLLLYKGNCYENCPDFLVTFNNECIEECPEPYFRYRRSCVLDCPSNTYKNEKRRVCQLIPPSRRDADYVVSVIDTEILEYAYDDSLIKEDNYTMQVFKISDIETINQLAEKSGISVIDISNCYDYLLEYYQIKENMDIIMIKVDLNISNSSVNDVEYFLYDFYGNELDISVCEKEMTIKVPILYPNILNLNQSSIDGINIFNSKDPFFNDICYIYKSKDGTDITLKDRRIDFYISKSLCNEDCSISKVNVEELYVECSCEGKEQRTKEEIELDYIFTFPEAKESFSPISTNVLKCLNKAFGFFKINIGFWLQLSILTIEIILLIKIIKKGISQISNYLNLIEPKNIASPPKLSSNHLNLDKDSLDGQSDNIPSNNDKMTTDDFLSPSSIKRNDEHHQSRRHVRYGTPMFYNYFEKVKPGQNSLHPIDENINDNEKHFKVPTKKLSQKSVATTSFDQVTVYSEANRESEIGRDSDVSKEIDIKKINSDFGQKIKIHSNDELLELDFDDAKKNDKRNFCQIYWNYLQMGHIFFNTFCIDCFLEIRLIKIFFMFLILSLHFTFTSIFFSSKYISEIYHHNGKLSIKSIFIIGIFAYFLSLIIDFLLNKLSSSKYKLNKILIMEDKSHKAYKSLGKDAINCYRKKLIVFFVISFILLFFFWYYCSAWCSIYRNSQKFWLLASFITIFFSLSLPFILCLIPTLIRYSALKCNIKFVYDISVYINWILI